MKGSAFGCCPSFFIQQVFATHSPFLCRQFTGGNDGALDVDCAGSERACALVWTIALRTRRSFTVQILEEKFDPKKNELKSLSHEIVSLKKQLETQVPN